MLRPVPVAAPGGGGGGGAGGGGGGKGGGGGGGGGNGRHLTVAATKEKTIKNTKPKHNVQGKNLY